MRLGGRLAAAIEVLEDIGRRHRPVADAVHHLHLVLLEPFHLIVGPGADEILGVDDV